MGCSNASRCLYAASHRNWPLAGARPFAHDFAQLRRARGPRAGCRRRVRPRRPFARRTRPEALRQLERVRFMMCAATGAGSRKRSTAAKARRIAVTPAASPRRQTADAVAHMPTCRHRFHGGGVGDIDLTLEGQRLARISSRARSPTRSVHRSSVADQLGGPPADGVYRAEAVDRIVTPLSATIRSRSIRDRSSRRAWRRTSR